LPLIEAGKLRGLGVSSMMTDKTKGLPPLSDEVAGFSVEHWQGLSVPKGTPNDIVNKLYAAIKEALSDPEVKKQIETLGLQPVGSTPAEFDELVKSETVTWQAFLLQAKIAQ
jgi:tripartite-type tricarboxylate transporter receptor subunit TctC